MLHFWILENWGEIYQGIVIILAEKKEITA